MKKMISLLCCAAVLLSFTACSGGASGSFEETKAVKETAQTEQTSAGAETPSVQIPNPFEECDTLGQAEEIAGFSMTAPDHVEGYEEPVIHAVKNEMIQINYPNGEEKLCIRKGEGDKDISGDYNMYEETGSLAVGDLQVTTRGNNGKISVATWNCDGYTFSITSGQGMSESQITGLIQAVK